MRAEYQPDVASASRGRFGHAGLAFLLYSVLAVVLTYPLIRQMGSVVRDLGDPLVSFPVKRTVRKETGRPLKASAET